MRDSANDHFTDHLVGGGAAELRPAAARSKDHVFDPHGDRSPRPPDVGESLSERAPEARATQAAVGSPAFARKGPTSTFMPLTAHVSAKAPTGALAQASATAPKTPREARRITSNADIGTSGCVPGARRAKPPPAVYELGTASEDSNRRAVIPGWRETFLQSIWS
jgi:hypothetical protein